MRVRTTSALAAMLLALVPLSLVAPALAAEPSVLAQAPDTTDEGDELIGEEQEQEGQEGGTEGEGEGEGQAEPEAEVGSGEDETGAAETEAGPLWTYQMSKIVIVLLLLMGLGIAGAYYQFVVKRQRQGF